VKYEYVNVSELSKLDEAFFSNSSHEIVPVVKIDEAKIGNGLVGSITQELMKAFHAKTISE